MITLRNQTGRPEHLPGMINKALVSYEHDADSEQREAASRQKLSPETELDDSRYDNVLRPGVMVGSSKLLATSGLPLKSTSGRRYITVPSHCFPAHDRVVYHPHADGVRIGEVKETIGSTGISLAVLDYPFEYGCTTLASEHHSNPPEIKELQHPTKVRIGDLVAFDSPFAGFCDGTVVGKLYEKVSIDEVTSEEHWVRAAVIYTGYGQTEAASGPCGSVVWDEQGRAVGFHGFMKPNGEALLVSVEPLLCQGFKVEAIQGRRWRATRWPRLGRAPSSPMTRAKHRSWLLEKGEIVDRNSGIRCPTLISRDVANF